MNAATANNIATLGGVGRFPLAPGTLASIVTALPALASSIGLLQSDVVRLAYIAIAVSSIALGFPAVRKVCAMGDTDPPSVVIDEVVGMSVVLLFAYAYIAWYWWLGAVMLFRLFDIVKPWPISRINASTSVAAVFLDDAVAGAFTLITLHLGWLSQQVLVLLLLHGSL